MMLTSPTDVRQQRALLAREPQAAGQARGQVRAALRAWAVPVDPDLAVLLASDLVTAAVWSWAGPTVTLGLRCSRETLRVDVTEAPGRPPRDPAEAAVVTGYGLVLVAALSDDWGAFGTPAGRAMYFTLGSGLRPAPGPPADGRPETLSVGTVSRKPRPARRPH
jgi:hypothetical protein